MRLLPVVYNELRRLAHFQLRHERSDHTLQSCALVHEANTFFYVLWLPVPVFSSGRHDAQ
jgi:hypothetical protein